jgi:hypothetical protein
MEVEMEEDRSLFVVVVVVVVVAVVVRFIAKSGWEKGGRESESSVGYEKVGGCGAVKGQWLRAGKSLLNLKRLDAIGDKVCTVAS